MISFRPIQSLRATIVSIFLTLVISSSALAQSCPLYASPHQRIGINVTTNGGVSISDYDTAQLGAGWYHNYAFRQTPSKPGGIHYHQMVRSNINRNRLPEILGPVISNNLGTLWILGNEPDHYGQDSLTPAQYAQFYHDVYTYLKAADPTARIAIAGIVQPTPIRLRYLDMVLSSYQEQYDSPMPVEIWDIHNFILPENCGWGASIPPGLEAYRSEGIGCDDTLLDHGDLNIFRAQIRTFRQWMADRGFRNTPLIITEYGILLSKYHGYDHPRVRDFMLGSFDFMLNETDRQIGYPADGNRLVQEFAWFSLNFAEFDLQTNYGLNGNLFDHDSRSLMPLGADFAAYTAAVTVETIDLLVTDFRIITSAPIAGAPVEMQTEFVNRGGIAAQDVTVEYWKGNPNQGGELLGSTPLYPQVLTGCIETEQSEFTWTPEQGGVFTLFTVVRAGNDAFEVNPIDNSASRALVVEEPTPLPTFTATVTPIITGTTTPTGTQTSATPTPATPTPTPTLVTPTVETPTPTPTVSSNSVIVDPSRTTAFTYTSGDQVEITIVFPVGSTSEAVEIRYQPWTGSVGEVQMASFTGRGIELTAYRNGELLTDFSLLKPIIITMNYLDTDLGVLDEQDLTVQKLGSNNAWQRQGFTLIRQDMDANQIVVSYSDSTQVPAATRVFALFADDPATPTPTMTSTPKSISTPTPTPTQTKTPDTELEGRIYLPFINGGS